MELHDGAVPERDGPPAPTGPSAATTELAPMRAADGPRLVRFHRTLSPETTYRRFFMVHTELTPEEVDHFVHVDHHDREAVVAAHDGELVGVGRFDRIDGGPSAEVAFLVADAAQGRGIGRALFDHLADRARAEGIETFVAEVLPTNQPMLRLFRNTGLVSTRRFEDGLVQVELDLGATGG